ncbi:MAG: MerR family transcriptional regulator [Eubacteriales bacterium]|nr:MerR family transcriptional regulator [Eubacteriales bacterium]
MTDRDNRLLTIGETAKAVHVTRRMILNYESRGLIVPDVKEGVAGNRYYSPDTLTRIRSIRVFQNLGLSLDDIYSYFNDTIGLAPLIKRLEDMRNELNLSIERLRARLNTECPPQIQTTTLPRQMVYLRTYRAVTVEERKERLRDVVPAAMRAFGTDVSKRIFFIEFPLDDPDLVSFCVSVPPESAGEFVHELTETQALCLTWHGGYQELPFVREQLLAYAAQEGLALTGTCRHLYLEGPPQHKEECNFITQVALPLLDARSDK